VSNYQNLDDTRPGVVVLFGSGETSPSGRKVLDSILRTLPPKPHIRLLETPAGFELNSAQVIGKVGEFIDHRLQNYQPQVKVVPARQRGTDFSPDDEKIASQLLDADMIFMGPGSPTYAVRQLQDSLTWKYLLARHRLGAAVVLASAAAIAISTFALPVYEIYKVGEDLHWKAGLDLFGSYGLPLVFIPHWNNQDGGDELDTSRCFMGQSRFAALMEQLPPDLTVMGIDEKTALILDMQTGEARVMGLGGVTLIHTGHKHDFSKENPVSPPLLQVARRRRGHVHQYFSGDIIPLKDCCPFDEPIPWRGLPAPVWETAWQAHQDLQKAQQDDPDIDAPAQVAHLVDEREKARQQKQWQLADELRDQIAAHGWRVLDTPDGPQLEKLT
jgi:cyanophycinase-like exopeptidase